MKAVCAALLCLVAVAAASFGVYPYHHYPVYTFNYGYGHGYNVNAVPHHGHFYFLGNYGGACGNHYDYGFYHSGYAGQEAADSYIVCDHGRAFRFNCPAGTVNGGDFKYNTGYGMHDICTAHA